MGLKYYSMLFEIIVMVIFLMFNIKLLRDLKKEKLKTKKLEKVVITHNKIIKILNNRLKKYLSKNKN